MGHQKTFTDNPKLDSGVVERAFKISLIVGVLGLGVSAIGLVIGERQQFFFSYLIAFAYFTFLGVAALFFTMLHHLVRAGWSTSVRRLAENAAGTLPLMALLFVPVIVGLHDLYHWSHASALAADPVLRGKAGYLNQGFFIVRAVVFFGVWILLANFFRSTSVRQDASGDHALSFKMRRWAPIGVLCFALSITFAGFDWLMSTDPHWFSTMFGLYTFAGSLVCLLAFLGLAALWVTKDGALTQAITVGNLHDIGKLLFGFTIFWAYIAFSQYYLIWYANIPEETAWYFMRQENGWDPIFKLIIVGHFMVPFWVLMSRHMKRRRQILGLVCGWMMAMHYVDLYFVVMPVKNHHLHLHWLDLTTFLGVGGLFVAAFVRQFRKDAAVPHKDPQLIAAMNYDNS